MQISLIVAFGVLIAVTTSLLQHEHGVRRIGLTALVGAMGALIGMFAARAVWLYGPPSRTGVFSAAMVGAIIALAIEQLALSRPHVA